MDETHSSRLRRGLDVLLTLALIAVCAKIIIGGDLPGPSKAASTTAPSMRDAAPALPVPTELIEAAADAPVLGSESAKIAVVMFSDFQCAFCGLFARQTLPRLEEQYVKKGLLQVVYRHLPYERTHPFARKAALASTCADKQGQFWKAYQALFVAPKAIERSITDLPQTLNMDPGMWATCMDAGADANLDRDIALARDLKVTGTPTFFVGKIDEDRRVKVHGRLNGAVPVKKFQEMIDPLLGADPR